MMPKSLRFLLILITMLWVQAGANAKGAAVPHDFHVSITHIDYNPQHNSLEITVKIFTDDLEATLERLGSEKLRLGSAEEHPEAETGILEYLRNRLVINVNEKATKLIWVGRETELDATWIYLEISDCAPPKQIQIQNRILTELFDDQSNLVHVQVGGTKKSLMLNKGFAQDGLSF